MSVHGYSGIRAHHSAGYTTCTFEGLVFNYFGRGITVLVDLSRHPNDFFGTDRNTKITTLTLFGIYDDIV